MTAIRRNGSRHAVRAGAAVAAITVLVAGCGLREGSGTADSLQNTGGSVGTGSGTGVATGSDSSTGAGSGAVTTGSGATSGSSAATTGSGSATTGSGPATTGSGPATTGSGPATTGSGPATTGTAPGGTSGGAPAPSGGGITISGDDSQGVSDDSIKIGVLAPISGAAGFLGQNQSDGVAGFFGALNQKGGVKGRKVKTVVVDTQFDPAAEATGARQLVDQQKVFAMIGVLGDSAAPFVTSKGIPNVVLGITPPAFSSKYPTTYPVTLNTVQSTISLANWLVNFKKAPVKSVSVLYDTQNMNIKPWVSYLEKAWTVQGVAVKSTDPFNLSDAACDAVVTKVKNLKIDFWSAGQSLGWPICLAAAARAGYKPPLGIGGPYSADTKFIGGAGAGSDGVYAQMTGVQIRINKGQPYPQAPNNTAPEVDNYINSVKTFGPNSGDTGSLENIWTQSGWVAAKLLAEAVNAQNDAITWKGVNQYIQSLTAWKSGLVQPINFKPDCKTGAEPWIFQWQRKADGSLVESDWKPYGGPNASKVPAAIQDKVFPGAKGCYVSRIADSGIK